MGYESNDVGVLTNVSSDHLDLQGIHTLPELAEVKSTVVRVTKPDGWCVLNADDPLVAALASRVRATRRVVHARAGRLGAGPAARGDVPAMGEGMRSDGGVIVELDGRAGRRRSSRSGASRSRSAGVARHNVANALAAAAAARGLGLVDRSGRRRPGRLPTLVGSSPGPPEPVPARVDDRHRRLRPQRGRGLGRARRRRGDRGRRGGPGGAGHGDRRDGRRSAGRHAPGHRPDRRVAGAAGRDQGDAEVPPGTVAGGRRRGDAGRRQGRGPFAVRGDGLRDRDRGPPRRAGERGWPAAGHRADVPRGARRGVRAARQAGSEADRRRRASSPRSCHASRSGPAAAESPVPGRTVPHRPRIPAERFADGPIAPIRCFSRTAGPHSDRAKRARPEIVASQAPGASGRRRFSWGGRV